MAIKIGDINKLKVKRETNISYILYPLDNIDEEIFLHFNETKTPLKENQIVDAFLYYDNKKRLAATTYLPTVTVSKIGMGKCVDVKFDMGCFMNIGISKDILLSCDDLPKNINGWPKVGEELPLILKTKPNHLVAKIPSKEELRKTVLNKKVKDETEAIICGFTSTGVFAVTRDFEYIYIHKSMLRKKYHIGEIVNVTIVGINEHNEYNGSLIKQKETMMIDDSKMIINYLNEFGTLPLGDKSTPEDINKIFPLSKSAFKRAIGTLYKQRAIEIYDYKIILIKDNN